MGTVTQASEDDSDVEGEVDLKVELISALEELRKSRMKNKSLKEKLSKDKESSQIIIDLKNQLQETKRIEEDLVLQLKKKKFYSKEDSEDEILFMVPITQYLEDD